MARFGPILEVLGLIRAILDLFQRVLAYFETNWDQFRPFWAYLDLDLGMDFGHFLANFGVLGMDLGHSGPISEGLGLL